MVADEPAREADQDRREGRQPRALRDIPAGRGRGVATDVRGNLVVRVEAWFAMAAAFSSVPPFLR